MILGGILVLKGKKMFSIVMPVYNTGKFLHSSINSLLNQTLNFENNVEIILVNDGSTDNTEKICKKYVKDYPHNISYIAKQNGGVGSARNVGIKHAKGEWIGFLDPDDTYSLNVLFEVQKNIREHKDTNLFCIPMAFFERVNKAHRLNFKFKATRVIDITEEPSAVQLSSASTFVKKSLIKDVEFPSYMPVGEDMVFLNRIFKKINHYGVISNVMYHYRKRYDKSSIMDSIEENEVRYIPYVQHAMLNEIPHLLQQGKLSKYHQNVFLYEIAGKVKTKEKPEPLQKANKFKEYLDLVWNVLQYIDEEIILQSIFLDKPRKFVLIDFKRHGSLRKLADIFDKSVREKNNNLYINDNQGNILRALSGVLFNVTNFQQKKNNIQIMGYFETFFNMDRFAIYFENNKKMKINVSKTMDTQDNCYFLGQVVKNIYKIKAELPADFLDKKCYLILKDKKTSVAKKVHFNFRGRKARILKGIPGSSLTLGQKTIYYNSTKKSLLITSDQKQKEYLGLVRDIYLEKYKTKKQPWDLLSIRKLLPYLQEQYRGKVVNIFMDRVLKADDNAEALIKYFNTKNTPDVLNYFVLSQESQDFHRLKKAGINVVAYGSFEHLKLMLIAKNLIVSQMAWAVVEPFYEQYKDKLKDLFTFNLIFLQHGVIMCDVSNILKKSKIGVDLFVNSAFPENKEISQEKYEYDNDELILTGLPRHDNLTKKKGKYIAIMPTWSREVVSKERKNDLRLAIPGFKKTDYFKKWNNLLNDKTLLTQAEKMGYKIIFVPHPELRGSVDQFDLKKVELASFDTRYVDIINNSSCVITDRSSVFMDFAYAEKKVFYYGPYDNNNYDDGYFDFETDGFGPVINNEKDVIKQVIESMKNRFELDAKYKQRRDNFFAFNDSNNCERVYEQISEISGGFRESNQKKGKLKNRISTLIRGIK